MYEKVIYGKIVDPVDGIYTANIGINSGIIEKISENELAGNDTLFLMEGQMIFPGFIDTHVHMREPGWEHKEDFLTGSMAALNGGVMTVLDMPNLPEPIITAERLQRKIELSKKSLVDVKHFAGVGRLDTLKEMAPLAVGYKIYTAESTGELTLESWDQIDKAVQTISETEKPITFHCEDQSINDKASETLKGKSYPELHCDMRPRESEISALEKVLNICKKHGTKANIAHISTEESTKIINENKTELELLHEITPHHVFFTREDMKEKGSLLKMNPPLRRKKDLKALIESLRNGEGTLATDHAPHTIEEKNSAKPPSGTSGLDTYGNFVLWLMTEHKVSPENIAKVTSYNAAKFFGLKGGRIKEGFPVKFSILTEKGETKITKDMLKTKCGWSSFEGITFRGRVVKL